MHYSFSLLSPDGSLTSLIIIYAASSTVSYPAALKSTVQKQ